MADEETRARVRELIRLRRRRGQFFDATLFADPAWDILLELYEAELAQHRLSISSVCIGAAVPSTTALRWINTLEKKGLVRRADDPMDGRRVFLSLTFGATEALSAYLRV
jgi:DNA-binding MarR family transcriptional regulator